MAGIFGIYYGSRASPNNDRSVPVFASCPIDSRSRIILINLSGSLRYSFALLIRQHTYAIRRDVNRRCASTCKASRFLFNKFGCYITSCGKSHRHPRKSPDRNKTKTRPRRERRCAGICALTVNSEIFRASRS